METSQQKRAGELARGVAELGLDIDRQMQETLLEYLQLLVKWNRTYNLSGIRDPDRMLGLHLLDSLSLLPFIDGNTILDAGSGAGLPGIPLAICMPGKDFILLDSNGKKTRFLFNVAANLHLHNVEVVKQRVEDFQSERQIDIVTTRAFASLGQTLAWTGHLLERGGRLLAMKGTYPEHEIASLPEDFYLRRTHTLTIPGESGSRHLLEITRGGIVG